jgi:hypothetical protein
MTTMLSQNDSVINRSVCFHLSSRHFTLWVDSGTCYTLPQAGEREADDYYWGFLCSCSCSYTMGPLKARPLCLLSFWSPYIDLSLPQSRRSLNWWFLNEEKSEWGAVAHFRLIRCNSEYLQTKSQYWTQHWQVTLPSPQGLKATLLPLTH